MTKVVETLSEKDPFGSTSAFSVSNFDISTPSPLFNVVTRWKCPRSVLQHWKGGDGGLAINKKDAFWNYGRTPIESVCFAQMCQHFSPWLQVFVFVLQTRRSDVSKKNCFLFNENFPAEKTSPLLESIWPKLFIDRTLASFPIQNTFFFILSRKCSNSKSIAG